MCLLGFGGFFVLDPFTFVTQPRNAHPPHPQQLSVYSTPRSILREIISLEIGKQWVSTDP